MARKGDLIVVNARRVGGPPREGEVIEVIEGELRVQYRVRWSDGHESLFAPGPGASRIEPARDGAKTSSEGTEPKKLPVTASTAKKSTAAKTTAKKAAAKTTTTKKSTAKTAKKSTAKKSAAKTAKKSPAKKSAVRLAETRIPILAGSPWIRMHPHLRFSRASRMISSQVSESSGGLPSARFLLYVHFRRFRRTNSRYMSTSAVPTPGANGAGSAG